MASGGGRIEAAFENVNGQRARQFHVKLRKGGTEAVYLSRRSVPEAILEH
jgi:hypothetical protein